MAGAEVLALPSGRSTTVARSVESSVVARLRDGCREAMTEVYTVHLDAIYNYCYRRTGSWSVAEDLAATVFLEVWKVRRRAFEHDGSIRPWLYGVATNVVRNHLRSQRRKDRALPRLRAVETTDDHADDVVARLDAEARFQRLLDRLGEMPERDQAVFALVSWEGMDYAQAASSLGIPVGTVRSRLSRVRRQLRTHDSKADNETPVSHDPASAEHHGTGDSTS